MPPNEPFAILAEGRNCWRRASAARLSFLVDAKGYFAAVKSAILKARRSVIIVGWDVNSRALLEFPDEARSGVPNELGPFLDYVASRPNGPEVRVLTWDSPRLYALDREWLPQASFDWFTHPRMCFALDAEHPFGASQHQKIVVVDDRVAFLGGLDLTLDRLDDSSHDPQDPRRRSPDGKPYAPYHDLQVAVDGAAARAVAEVAEQRWFLATGERLARAADEEPTRDTPRGENLSADDDPWPASLAPDLTNVGLGIARTLPFWKGRPEIREIEALFLDAIAAAREWIYIENQYFSSNRVARALADRLRAPEGPEIVIVLPRDSMGWLEQTSMGLRRRHLAEQLQRADRHGRLRLYAPVVGDNGGVALKVHSKVMIVDGRHLHVGSANLNNRSMGLDSECDVALDTAEDRSRQVLVALRDRLLGEHLGVDAVRVADMVAHHGSLIAAIESLRGEGRSLVPLSDPPLSPADILIADMDLLDPAAPAEPERLAEELVTSGEDGSLRRGILRFGGVLITLLALAALWRWGPLSSLADVATLESWGAALREHWVGTLGVLAAYVVGSLVMAPVTALIAATGLLYGPVSGLLVAAAGSLLGALVGYAAGAALGRRQVRRLAGTRLDRLNRQLARRGVLSMAVLRLLPVAPFTVINLAAGASHIRFRDFLFGTVLGMAPGITGMTLFAGQLGRLLKRPDLVNFALLAALLLMIAGFAYWSWRRFVRRPGETAEGAD